MKNFFNLFNLAMLIGLTLLIACGYHEYLPVGLFAAIVRFGGGLAEMRGSIGGTTFSRTKAGAIARNRTSPTSQPTLRQSAVRNQFQNVVETAKLQTQEQVDSWNSFAQTLTRLNGLGESYVPQGSQIYLESAMNLAQCGLAPLSGAPVEKPDAPTLEGYTLIASEEVGSLDEFTLTPFNYSADGYFAIEATLPHNALRKNNEKYFRQISVVEVPDPEAAISLLAAYKNTFYGGGDAVASDGQVISVRVKEIALNGFATPWIYGDVTIAQV